jgi:hypothetical protein
MVTREQGISEVVATILVVFLVIALAVVVGVLVFGWALPLQKTAYIVMEVSPQNISNASVVQVFHGSGDTVSLAPSTMHGVPVRFTLTNGSATYNATPLPATAAQGFGPGATLFLFRNASGIWLSDNKANIMGNLGFTPGVWTISLIDTTANVLIAQDAVQLSGSVAPVYPRYPGFTVESWVNWNIPPNPGSDTTRKWATMVVDGTGDNNRRYQMQHNSDNTKFEFAIATVAKGGSGVWVASTTSPVKGTWYHVTGVYNKTPGTMAIFVNGVRDGSGTADSSGLRASVGRFQVGGPAGINWPGAPPAGQLRKLDGQVRGVQTWEEALSPQEILAHYQAGFS